MSNTEDTYIVGLTGGIGSGKSTVCDCFEALGIDIIDADLEARAVVAAGSPALAEIAGHFGPHILSAEGDLDRKALRKLVFERAEEKNWLENLLHPLIRERILTRIQDSTSVYTILCAPLLLESGAYDFVDRILVVDVPEAQQIARTMARDLCSEQEVKAIMASQLSRQQRLEKADDVIDNSQSLPALKAQVRNLHEFYCQEARGNQGS